MTVRVVRRDLHGARPSTETAGKWPLDPLPSPFPQIIPATLKLHVRLKRKLLGRVAYRAISNTRPAPPYQSYPPPSSSSCDTSLASHAAVTVQQRYLSPSLATFPARGDFFFFLLFLKNYFQILDSPPNLTARTCTTRADCWWIRKVCACRSQR